MSKPRLLDLFCGAGGASMGYHRAGFEVVGVDINPQPHYPFTFFKMDWADGLHRLASNPDVIHASPPCQRYSSGSKWEGTWEQYPDLLPAVREALIGCGRPYIIENVPGAPMRGDIVLCGCQFGLGVRRKRLFETSLDLPPTLLPPHKHDYKAERVYGAKAPDWLLDRLKKGVGNLAGLDPKMVKWRAAMAIDWMETRTEIGEAIPPAYTEFIGRQLMVNLGHADTCRPALPEHDHDPQREYGDRDLRDALAIAHALTYARSHAKSDSKPQPDS